MFIRVNWVKECCFLEIIMESDNLEMVNALKQWKVNETCFGAFITDTLSLVGCFRSIVFNHVKRKGNRVAHELPKLALTNSNIIWMEDSPYHVQNLAWLDILGPPVE
ncbi:hypothetical protein AHAS_Ahas11G0223100 [Arachis hypogaea]